MSDNGKLTLGIVGILVITAVICTLVSWLFGWISLPFRKGSVTNVETQFTYGYTTMQSLEASANTVCNFEVVATNTTDVNAQNQRMSQLLQYEANYNRIEAQYDAWAANFFQGKIIRPADLPMVAPTLDQMKQRVCE